MNSLTAAELKRRGWAALEESLQYGPVHITKHNKAAAVVLSEDEYSRLTNAAPATKGGVTAAQWLLAHAAKAGKSKADLDRALRKERDAWT
jgi:prevent-host-death family protein